MSLLSAISWKEQAHDNAGRITAINSGQGNRETFFKQLENIFFILDQISDAIYITDGDRNIMFWNRAAEEITGYKAEEVLGKRCADDILVHTDMAGNELCGSDFCPLFQAMRTGKSSETPLMVKAKHKDGGRVVVEVSLSPLRNAGGEVIGGLEVFRNISEKVEFEEEKARFFSALSHELKTPLTSTQGYLKLLLEGDAGSLNETQEQFLNIIYREEEKLYGVIEELLEIGRFESTDYSYRREVTDLSLILENLVSSFSGEVKKKGLYLNCTILRGLMLMGDRERLGQAMGNLISNAIKYTDLGGIDLVTEREAGDAEIAITISDSGIGIPAEDLEGIFEIFYRVANSGTRSKGGAGVGLYIVKRIVERHDGRIEVKSTPGRGSTFKVFLPGLKQ